MSESFEMSYLEVQLRFALFETNVIVRALKFLSVQLEGFKTVDKRFNNDKFIVRLSLKNERFIVVHRLKFVSKPI